MVEIPAFYRIFFLYIDPLVCLSGIYVLFFDHATYLTSSVPHAIPVKTIDPLTRYLLTALGSYCLCIFGIQIFLLRQFLDIKIWRIVMFSILLTDLSLLYGVYATDPKGFCDVGGWTSGDWTNNGILLTVIGIRSSFLLGI
ncbi:hypothetical protein ONS95_009169 [Cadophora gregata]|uniref:uncharacterized protein n=1 Tax=Cadophora gregata TaxID=51156 RepID=UPI0026DD99C0|nr:uncharacterized protein ONS95_009169 [Cadophora gregata]KAK0124187.1 hypothetical protein ONS95_009169 [Cadophora gregata]